MKIKRYAITENKINYQKGENLQMKIKQYTITENKKINNDYLKKYVTENDISQNEIAKIQIERPSEIIVFQDEAGKMAGSLNLWHNRSDYNEKKTSYIGNVMIFEKYRKEEFEKEILFKSETIFKVEKVGFSPNPEDYMIPIKTIWLKEL